MNGRTMMEPHGLYLQLLQMFVQFKIIKPLLRPLTQQHFMKRRGCFASMVTLHIHCVQLVLMVEIHGVQKFLEPQLIAKAEEVASHIVKLPPLSVRMVKESITHSLDVPNLKDASLADLYRFGMLELTQDTQEAHNAWREKRSPVFKGE